MSLYLFLICAEGLTALLKKAKQRGEIHGAILCRGAPSFSHILFVDNCFCFTWLMNRKEGKKIKEILNEYEMAFGQAINMAKSKMFFSRNTS